MFTGIIEEIGRMKLITRKGEAMEISIDAAKVLEDVHLGDSISVNGVCLTVTSFTASNMTMDIMPETFKKTNLYQLNSGSRVNLERAMSANGRFGGHLVQGHVDGVGIIRKRRQEQNAVVYTIEPKDSSLFQYMINQGSITLDGISLTIVEAHESSFTVSIIPHTLAQTILNDKQAGDTVNIECDLLGKYVNHLLHYKNKTPLSKDFLVENGFM